MRQNQKHDLRLLLLALLLLASAFVVRAVAAHGGGTPRLTNHDIGPYWISVWTAPQPPREGVLHITIAVAEPGEAAGQQAGAPVLGATVDVTLTPPASGLATVYDSATNEQSANKLFYEADVIVPVAGEWLVTVAVQGPEGEGQAQFPLIIEPARAGNWFLWGGVGLLAIAGFYVYYAGRRNKNG